MKWILCYIFLFITASYCDAQISWNLTAEAGYFKTSGEDLILQDDILTRLNGQVKMLYSESSHEASFSVNIHPEYLGAKNKTALLKVKADGSYFNYSDNLNAGVNFSVIKNNYFGDLLDVKYDIFSFQPALITSFLGNPLSTFFGYTNQRVEYGGNIIYDLIYNETEYLFLNDRYFVLGAGLYTERFVVENEYNNYGVQKLSNKGWRAGPLINIKYLRDFIISSSYRVMMHFSESVHSPSYEHQIMLLAGKVLFEKYSIFLLADFYIRDFKLKNGNSANELVYSPVNQQNKYFLKLAYELTEHSDFFLRTGYSKENVDYITNSIAGWSFTAGVELR